MFEDLSINLKKAWDVLAGKKKISSADLDLVLGQIKRSLLEADVAIVAINHFLNNIRSNALNSLIDTHFTAEQFLIKLANKELIKLMGEHTEINLKTNKPAVILVVGLQGSGKTTTCAKLAKYIQQKHQKTTMLVSCDLYRPAAVLQLEQVANQVGSSFFGSNIKGSVDQIATLALEEAKKQYKDVLIVDTAGRLHVDHSMMDEAKLLHKILEPIETLFVVDGMTGQDAANTAKQFNIQLPLTGVILTKLDSDARGGAALSVRHVTEKPIKFYTTGEKLDDIEVFYPDRIASRILGMGDLLSLIEQIEAKVDQEQAEKVAKQVMKGQFNFIVLRDQLLQMKNMGGINNLLEKIPGFSFASEAIKSKINDDQIKSMIAIIDSMTYKEKIYPSLLNVSSRKNRICRGSGVSSQQFSKLIRHYQQMEKMTKKLANPGNLFKMIRGIKDQFPPGFMDL